jgi:hypothetical protein
MRIQLVRCRGWAVFAALVVGLAVALYFFLPPQPRWRVHLEADEQVFLVEPVHGRVFTEGDEGVTALDLFTGRRLGLVVAGKRFTRTNQDMFSPDHRYLAVRFDSGRQIAVVDVATLQANRIDLHVPGDKDRVEFRVFSPGSEWLMVRLEDENHHPVKEVVAEAATGKIVLQTERGTYFCGFVPQSNLVVFVRDVVEMQQYAYSVWDLGTGQMVHETPPFLGDFMDRRGRGTGYPSDRSADRRTLIACRESSEGRPELVAWDILDNRLLARLPAEIWAPSSRAAVSQDGKLLILTASPDGTRLVFFDLTTGTVKKEHRLPVSVQSIRCWDDPTLATCDTADCARLKFRLPDGELVLDSPADGDDWRATPDPAITYRLTFAGLKGHLLLDGEFAFHFRDSRTGRVVAFGPRSTDSRWPPEHQFGRRLLFVRSEVTREASPADELRRWLPGSGGRSTSQIDCIDLATGGEVGRLTFPDSPRFHFAEGHGLLASWHRERDGREMVACWEAPFRPGWAWVLGPPLGLVALAGWRSLRRLRRATPPALLDRHPVPNSRSPASPRPGTM